MSHPLYAEPESLDGHATYPPSTTNFTNPSLDDIKAANEGRRITRTPSPTPSEARELRTTGAFDWKTLANWRFWIRREWLWYYVAFIIIFVITALVSIYHTQIVHWLRPVADWMHKLSFGWIIPILVLFVLSFPPLFGHEIVAVLCGLVWGLWIGFGIVAAGTFIGEVGNFYAFKYCCRARGEKMERNKIAYGCLAKVVRDGGFKIAFIARLSAIPGHFTTAVFSTCGMGIIVFSLAAILSLPKQFITVYLGVILEQSETGKKDVKSQIISDVVLAITFIITLLAMWYIYHQMGKVKADVIYQRRKGRQAKLTRADFGPYDNPSVLESTAAFNPRESDTDIPLKPTGPSHGASPYQHWDKRGHAVGYAGDPTLYSPQPTRGNAYGAEYKSDDGYSVDDRSRESIDSVGWDMQPSTSGENIPPRFTSPPGVARNHFTSTETVLQPTPQARYVDHSANTHPTPAFPSSESTQQLHPTHYSHVPEGTDATGASYYTATDGHSRSGTEVSDVQRIVSPPPSNPAPQ